MTSPIGLPKVGFHFVKVQEGKSIISYKGQQYEFTIQSKIAGTTEWKDITKTKNWDQLAGHISELFFEATDQKLFETAVLQLRGEFANLETEVKERPVTIASASVSYKENTQVKTVAFTDRLDTIPKKAHKKIKKQLNIIAKDFGDLKSSPSSSSRSETPPPNRRAPTKETVEEQIIEIDPVALCCRGRIYSPVEVHESGWLSSPTEKTGADYVIADQLSKMPTNNRKYSRQEVSQIVATLRTSYCEYIKNEKNKYCSDEKKFRDIGNLMIKAFLSKEKLFEDELNFFIGKEMITASDLDKLPNTEFKNISPQHKKIMIEIYVSYIKKGGQELGEPFLNAFIAMPPEGTPPDPFQLVVIDDSDSSSCYPPNLSNIHPNRCAFIHVDKKGNYFSYDRSEQLGFLSSLDNVPKFNPSKTTQRKTSSLSTIPKVNVDGTGRCLDKSLAYQILAKANPFLANNDSKIEEKADYLRTQAARIIKNDVIDTEEFFNSLHSSIMAIPTFSIASRKDLKNQSLASIQQLPSLLPDPNKRVIEIQRILAKKDYASTLPDERQTLRTFYSEYILQVDPITGKMNNYLDSAFLYVLPQIPIEGKTDYQYAVLMGNRLQARYPNDIEFKIDNSIFVLYNGLDHYDAVDMQNGTTQVSEIIKRYHVALLEGLFTLAKGTNPLETKKYLLETIQKQYPTFYGTLKGCIYQYDLKKWEVDQSLDKPGTKDLRHNGTNYPLTEYGDFRLHQIEAADLQSLLNSWIVSGDISMPPV
jgi:hypothetical protein